MKKRNFIFSIAAISLVVSFGVTGMGGTPPWIEKSKEVSKKVERSISSTNSSLSDSVRSLLGERFFVYFKPDGTPEVLLFASSKYESDQLTGLFNEKKASLPAVIRDAKIQTVIDFQAVSNSLEAIQVALDSVSPIFFKIKTSDLDVPDKLFEEIVGIVGSSKFNLVVHSYQDKALPPGMAESRGSSVKDKLIKLGIPESSLKVKVHPYDGTAVKRIKLEVSIA